MVKLSHFKEFNFLTPVDLLMTLKGIVGRRGEGKRRGGRGGEAASLSCLPLVNVWFL